MTNQLKLVGDVEVVGSCLTEDFRGVRYISSVLVASKFGKRSDNVLRLIEAGLETGEFLAASHCEVAEYVDAQGKPRKMYLLTQTGYAILISKFRLTEQEDLDLRKAIYIEFQNYQAQLHLRASLAPKNRKIKTHGYELHEDLESDYPKKVKVKREESTEEGLMLGDIAHRRAVIYGSQVELLKVEMEYLERFKCLVPKDLTNEAAYICPGFYNNSASSLLRLV